MNTHDNLSEKNRKIFESMPDTFYAGEIPSVRKKWNYPIAAAAILIPLLVLGISIWLKPKRTAAEQTAQITYYVERGVKGQVALADGSTVNLNSGSTLKILDDRRVYLEGEGWFEVKTDREHPFYVETPSGISVKVTGTKFNLSNYREEDFKVLLESGIIELEGRGKDIPAKIAPSEQVIVRSGRSHTAVADSLDKKNTTAWKEGMLVFDDKPLREAIPMLERWYGTHITVNNDALLEERLTGEFDTETIQEVMRVLALTHGFTYTINHKDITIALK
ncbi:MAG: DUF4974 domain-containing protein [Bacteroidales bacterium]|nr:DUF4974 domain-containing protein [Bacteroidales bacterium]